MPMTALQIVNSLARVPPGPDGTDRFDRAAKVAVTGLKIGTSKSTGLTRVICQTRTPEMQRGRLVILRYATTIDFHRNKRWVMMSCGCDDFKFMWEVALNRRQAAQIFHSNGDPANTRNPRHVPGCCKHLIRALSELADKGRIDRNFELK